MRNLIPQNEDAVKHNAALQQLDHRLSSLEQILSDSGKQEQDAAEKACKDAAKHNASLQQMDHRLALLERILSDLVSTGVNAGVNGLTSPGSVPERRKAEPPSPGYSRARERLRLSLGS